MIKQNATSTSNVEKWRSHADQAQAQVELAKINLGYTRVTAPFAGRIGQRLVDPGNLVGAGSATKLATLDQLLPIYVNFNLNERDALQMRAAMRKLGMEAKAAVGKAPVEVGLSNEKGYPHEVFSILSTTKSAVQPERSPCAQSSRMKTKLCFRDCSRACAFPRAIPSRCWLSPTAPSATTSRATMCSWSTPMMWWFGGRL